MAGTATLSDTFVIRWWIFYHPIFVSLFICKQSLCSTTVLQTISAIYTFYPARQNGTGELSSICYQTISDLNTFKPVKILSDISNIVRWPKYNYSEVKKYVFNCKVCIFKTIMYFPAWKLLCFDSIKFQWRSIRLATKIRQWSDKSLAPDWPQAIIRTSDDTIHVCKYIYRQASLG